MRVLPGVLSRPGDRMKTRSYTLEFLVLCLLLFIRLGVVCVCVLNMYNIRCAILPFLSVQFSGIKYVHVVVQPSPSSISTTFFLVPKPKLCAHKTVPLYSPAAAILLSGPVNLTIPGTSNKWNCTVFVLLLTSLFHLA